MSMLEAIDRGIEKTVIAILDGLSRRSCQDTLAKFRGWMESRGVSLNRSTVDGYIELLRDEGKLPATINRHLWAIRKLTLVMAANGELDSIIAERILSVKNVTGSRKVVSHLSEGDARRLLEAPSSLTIKGARDRAILAMVFGCGLESHEVANITIEQVGEQQIADVIGRCNRARSINLPSWVKTAIDSYMRSSGITTGPLFRSMAKGDVLKPAKIPTDAVTSIVYLYAGELGIDANTRNLRKISITLSEQESADYQARIIELEREAASLRRALNIKANLPHEQLKKAIVQYGE